MRKSPTPTKPRERKFSLFNFNFFSKGDDDKEQEPECELQSLVQSVVSAQPGPSFITHDIGVELGNFTAYEQEEMVMGQDLTPTNVEPPSVSLHETVVHVEHRPYSTEPDDDNQTIVGQCLVVG